MSRNCLLLITQDSNLHINHDKCYLQKIVIINFLVLQMFDWLNGNERGFITKDDVRNLSRDEMRALVLKIEGTDVSNTEEAEYGVIDVSQVR